MNVLFAVLWGLAQANPSYAQQEKNVQVLSQSDFTGGLNTRQASIQIGDKQAQAVQNVYLDEKGITKRSGSARRNATALVNGLAVDGLYEYKKSDGTDYCVAFSSRTGYSSTDKCASFTAFVSTLTAGTDVNCVPFQDRLYCANGTDASIYFDGTNDFFASEMPVCDGLRVHQNRLWCFGVAGNPSRVYFSNVNDGLNWDTTLQYVDFNPEDGDTVVSIGPPIFEVLPVYKKYSAWIIQGNQADNYTPVLVNNEIGANSHRTTKNVLLQGKTIQLFDSLGPKGSEPGIYFFNGIVVGYASPMIRDDLRDLANFTSAAKFKLWQTQANWETGTISGNGPSDSLSTTIDVGTIQQSTWTRTDTSGADFAAGTLTNVSTQVISGSVLGHLFYDNFSDGDYSNNPEWDDLSGTWAITGGKLRCSAVGAIHSTTTANTGIWTLKFKWGADVADDSFGEEIRFYPLQQTESTSDEAYQLVIYLDDTENLDYLRLNRCTSGSCSNALGQATDLEFDTTEHLIEFTRDSSGNMKVYYDNVLKISVTNTLYSTNRYFTIWAQGLPAGSYAEFDDVGIVASTTTASTLLSQTFDTAFSTPIWGLFTVSMSSDSDATLTFETQVATATDGVWDALVSATPAAKIPSAQKRYARYKGSFSTTVSTKTAELKAATLSAASTGVWTSAETFLDSGLSTWGLLQSIENNTGASPAWTYQMRAATYSGGTPDYSWTTVTNNATIGISTGAYVQARLTNSFGVATDTAKVDSLTINYNVGAPAKSSVGEVYKGRYYWFGQDSGSTSNDIAYVLDSNQAWTKHAGLYVRSAAIVDGGLYYGDSRSSKGYVYKYDEGTTDDGTAINASWKSKDFLLAMDEIQKAVRDIYVTYVGSGTTLGVTLYADGVEADTWNIDLTTSAPFGVRQVHVATASGGKRGTYFNVRFSNSAASEGFSVLGYRLHWEPVGFRR